MSSRQPPGLVMSVSAVTLNRQDRTSNAACSGNPPSPTSPPPLAIHAAFTVHILFCNVANSLFNSTDYSTVPHLHPLALTDVTLIQGHADIAVNTGLTFSTFFLNIFQ